MAAHGYLYQVRSLLNAKAPSALGGPKIIETKHPGALFHCLSASTPLPCSLLFTLALLL